jgi:hypothetical protein
MQITLQLFFQEEATQPKFTRPETGNLVDLFLGFVPF